MSFYLEQVLNCLNSRDKPKKLGVRTTLNSSFWMPFPSLRFIWLLTLCQTGNNSISSHRKNCPTSDTELSQSTMYHSNALSLQQFFCPQNSASEVNLSKKQIHVNSVMYCQTSYKHFSCSQMFCSTSWAHCPESFDMHANNTYGNFDAMEYSHTGNPCENGFYSGSSVW